MKKRLSAFCVLLCALLNAQTPFWIETFGTGCNQGQYANNFNPTGLGSWSVVSTGSNGTFKNEWFISSAEANVGIGNCGDGCVSNPLLSNRTLHIAFDLNSISPGFYDFGASYLAGTGYNTNRRVQSPTINCTGQSNIVLSFSYIMEGIAGSDYADVQYSADGGTTWTTIATPPPTNNASCSSQGFWTTYSVSLPASANNNPTVKVGFRWQNTDPNGADPSIAVDDVALKSMAPVAFAPSFTVASPICSGSSATVTANTGTFAVTGYTWSVAPSGPAIASPNASATSISFGTGNTYTITLTATSGGTTASSSNTMLVNNTPIVSSGSSLSNICSGQSLALTASGASTYTWIPGALTGSMIVITPTVSGSYTVTGTSSGCTGTSSVSYTVNPTPTVNASASPASLCAGASSTLTATGASTGYTWMPGSTSGSSVIVNPSSTTVYTVTGLSSACIGSATVSVSVTSNPAISASASPTLICVGSSGTLNATGASGYTWNPGNLSGSSVAVNPTVTTTYTCTGVNLGCTGNNTVILNVSTCTGIEKNNANIGFNVFPNPAGNELFVELQGGNKEVIQVEIIDVTGKVIITEAIVPQNSSVAHKIKLDALHSGLYFIKLKTGNESKAVRFIKE